MNVLVYIKKQIRSLSSRPNLQAVICDIISVINMIITHGDSFLPDSSSYDFLYYQIILNAETLQSFCCIEMNVEVKNILSVINFYVGRVDKPDIREEHEVLQLIRKGYNGVELVMCHFKKVTNYDERLHETYFKNLLQIIIKDLRKIKLK